MEQGAGFRRLRTWQQAHDLASAMFRILNPDRSCPEWLKSQACRAALSVPANIAEGYSRASAREYVRFLDIARGSLAECEYYVQFMLDNGLVTQQQAEELSVLVTGTGRLLGPLMKSISAKAQDGTWNRSLSVREEAPVYVVGGGG